MIQKFELQAVINKYYLNGLVESVKWEIKNKKLSIKYTSPTKEMIGEVTHSNFPLEDSNVGISNTSQLLKLRGITGGEVMINYIKNNKVFTKLIISDNQFTTNYTLADILAIPKTGAYTGPNEYNLETSLDKEMILALIKAKSALDDSKTVILKPTIDMDGEFQLELLFGGDIEYSNKVSYYLSNFVRNNVPYDFTLGFSSDLIKEILVVNKDAEEAKISINLEGLMKLEFKVGDIKSTYYIVQKEI
jgi:hypothetical protein